MTTNQKGYKKASVTRVTCFMMVMTYDCIEQAPIKFLSQKPQGFFPLFFYLNPNVCLSVPLCLFVESEKTERSFLIPRNCIIKPGLLQLFSSWI